MTGEGMQGMLFGSTGISSPAVSPGGQLRLCALNCGSPSPARAQQLLDWLLTTGANALVLTEIQLSVGGKLLMSGLAAEGFTTHAGPGWDDSSRRYFTLAAVRGFSSRAVQPAAFDPRIIAVDLAEDVAAVRLAGVYGPTNGMTAESSARRRKFQATLLQYLNEIGSDRVCLAGDLNVVEPGHEPHLASFEDHDYGFYTGLLELGLADAYRALNPAGGHSWLSDRFGVQRLDHSLIHPAAGTIQRCEYDHAPRLARLTDHAALLTTLQLASSS